MPSRQSSRATADAAAPGFSTHSSRTARAHQCNRVTTDSGASRPSICQRKQQQSPILYYVEYSVNTPKEPSHLSDGPKIQEPAQPSRVERARDPFQYIRETTVSRPQASDRFSALTLPRILSVLSSN